MNLERGTEESKRYDFKALEEKWRSYWQAIDLYRTGDDPRRPKFYILDFFPYPSGEGLSVGHCRNYVPTCVAARFKRRQGYNVLHPMGWDAFGLPAENYAIQHNVHPQITTQRQAANYRRQMQLVACSYDWSREINATDPEYYRWTQWFFLLLYKRGLAYRALGSQWWCPQCMTILANEQVENGRCWRCDAGVSRKELQQWYFRITDYADRLIDDLESVDWPESIKQMQHNWIGRSDGVEVTFPIEGRPDLSLATFTTRIDTLFGVTFLALAPEHPLVPILTSSEQQDAVNAYAAQTVRLSEIERQSTDETKSGVFSGAYARHPISGQPIPIWVADYVLLSYGTGAVMGVPGHDSRDHAFARHHALAVAPVIIPDDAAPAGVAQANTDCFTGYGRVVNSGPYSGLSSGEAITKLADDLERQGLGRRRITYKLRDWLISRQRFWGAPIPIVYCDACGTVPMPEEALPVRLPESADFTPGADGRSPLARNQEWVHTTCPHCTGPARRETDTMDGFACSSWYFLRFASPHEAEHPFEPAAARYWLPVDVYVGGAEHAVMHLLYARFWTKVMHDAGVIDFVEPFTTLRNQGVLHAPDGRRMSKSRGNVITPDEVIAKHGADALRTYILFIGPFDADVSWDESGMRGVTRFLERYWRVASGEVAGGEVAGGEVAGGKVASGELARRRVATRMMHRTIERVTEEFEQFKFNTAVAALMEYLNFLSDYQKQAPPDDVWRQGIETLTRLLAPIAPFVTEEVWQEVLGHKGRSVHQSDWPDYDESLLVTETVTLVVQVNGKVRARLEAPAGMSDAEVEAAVLQDEKVRQWLNGRPVRKWVIVPDRLVNVVTRV
jgi:leucyl-tRNA synthetase